MSFYKVLLKNPLVSTLSNHIDGYPTPVNLSYLWGLGSVAGIALVIQIVTGVLLAMHYAAEIHLAFASVEHIMRDVKGGVALRYIHANGASMFFIVVYLHMFRGLYYGSYFQPRSNLWYSGVLIFFLMMATAFMGYVLPWGQMSFWGATVITNLFSAIPGIGNQIVQLLWGGFSVDNPTLNRFFSLHYFLPFVIAGVALLHLVLLHQPGSNNPLGIPSIFDRIPFYPYFYVKDLFGFLIFVLIFSLFVIYAPNYMGHPDNYIEANPLVTPAHIVPEWYFLPFYAILRTVPDKLGGVALMGLAIVILVLLPIVDTSSLRSNFFKPLNIWFFWYFFADSISLGWIGQEIVESPFIEMGVFVTISYFLYFIAFLPLTGFLENAVIQNQLRHASLFSFTLNMYKTGGDGDSLAPLEPLAPAPKFVGGENAFFDFFNNLELFQVAFIGCFLLFLGMFFPKSGSFTRFLNRVGAFYLIYLLCNLSFNIVLRPLMLNTDSNEISITNNADFFQAINWLQSDSLFNHLFFCYILVMVIIFLYGISDRFFISNSYEIEFPVLVFFLHIASLFLFSVHSLLEFVLAIEIITLGSYGLVAFERKNRFSTYAGVQYFILGSVPSGLLILSIGLLYKAWGTFAMDDLDLLMGSFAQPTFLVNFWEFYNFFNVETQATEVADASSAHVLYTVINDDYIKQTFDHYLIFEWNGVMNEASKYSAITLLALLLLFSNLLFKLTAAPFHFWAPSVYGKAPIATVTFLSIFSKAMILFALFKLLFTVFYTFKGIIMPFLIFVSVLSVLLGMIGAFSEKIIKRFFVYSSMGHVGFMLISLSLSSYEGIAASFHYLPVYIITSFLMWFILLHMGSDKNHLTHFAMLRLSDPLLALIFALLIFSMSGIPPLGGFFVKLDVLIALLENSRLYTNAILLFFTVASFFYYLRVVKIIFFDNTKIITKSSDISDERLWMIGLLFIILFFYIFLIQKPLLIIQNEALAALF
jgi:ubiquinol-cytochrome c reductase cytochrome b subunit